MRDRVPRKLTSKYSLFLKLVLLSFAFYLKTAIVSNMTQEDVYYETRKLEIIEKLGKKGIIGVISLSGNVFGHSLYEFVLK